MRCVACAWGAGVRVLRAAGLALVLGMVALASAQTPRAATVQLNDAAGTIEAEVLGQHWLDAGGTATIDQVARELGLDPAGRSVARCANLPPAGRAAQKPANASRICARESWR